MRFALAIVIAGMVMGLDVRAQAPSQDALPPSPTVKLTQEQRHTVKEIIIKEMKVAPQEADVPKEVGSVMPSGVPLQPIPVEVSAKIPQLKTHSFVVKDDTVIIVDPKDNKVAELVK
jgi:hypothetical protein